MMTNQQETNTAIILILMVKVENYFNPDYHAHSFSTATWKP